jgi:DNA-directed RNA polymerase III subunit RPC2
MLCPADTPEGETCGLVKNLALLAHVTTDAEVEKTKRSCFDLGVEQLGNLNGTELNSHAGAYLVFLNGLVIGACWKPHKLASALRWMRRSKKIGEFVSVYTHAVHRAIYVACDGGRVCRPLIIATRGHSRLTSTRLATALNEKRAKCKDLSTDNYNSVFFRRATEHAPIHF